MKVVIAPDKFKGSLTCFEVCRTIASGIKAIHPSAETLEFPMADGGDGFAAVMKYYLHTTTISCPTQDPLGRPITASFELKDHVAIIEMASASGLVLLKETERNVLRTSTYGTGILIREAIQAGAREIILGLGGSATNDAGAGILAALGFQFADEKGHPVQPCGGQLINIHSIIPPAKIPGIRFSIACDVQNVLCGEEGAAYVYGPQKGAKPQDVAVLDNGLRNFAQLLKKDIANIPGVGAAGGIAAGLMGFFDVRLEKGIQLVMDISHIAQGLPHTDLVITGEGRIDRQTAFGKVISEVALLSEQHDIPAIAFCGATEVEDSRLLHLKAIRAITPAGMPFEEARLHAKDFLKNAVSDYFQ